MALFPEKTKTVAVTYVGKLVVIIGKEKYHHHSHSDEEIKSLIIANGKKLDKILKAVGTPDNDAQLRQEIFNTLTKVKAQLEKTV